MLLFFVALPDDEDRRAKRCQFLEVEFFDRNGDQIYVPRHRFPVVGGVWSILTTCVCPKVTASTSTGSAPGDYLPEKAVDGLMDTFWAGDHDYGLSCTCRLANW